MPAPASAASAEPPAPDPEALLSQYAAWLAARGRGNRCFADGAAGFLRRWPDPRSFAAEPLEIMLAQDQQTRPFITFLLLHDLLRPGYGYLVNRKFASLVELARGTRMEAGPRRIPACRRRAGILPARLLPVGRAGHHPAADPDRPQSA